MRRHRIHAVIRRHVYEARHNLDRMTDAFYWPVIDVLMWGFFTISVIQMTHRFSSLTQSLLAAVIVWGVFRAMQRDMASGFLTELWSRNLVNLLVTPLSVTEYLFGLLIISSAKAVAGMAVAGAIAWSFYDFHLISLLPCLLPFLIEMLVFAVAVGLLIIALVCRFNTRVQGLAWNLTGILMPLSCVFYPVDVLPTWLRVLAYMLPTTHVFEGMRATLNGKGFAVWSFVWAFTLDVVYLSLSLVLLHTNLKAARADGLLIRFE